MQKEGRSAEVIDLGSDNEEEQVVILRQVTTGIEVEDREESEVEVEVPVQLPIVFTTMEDQEVENAEEEEVDIVRNKESPSMVTVIDIIKKIIGEVMEVGTEKQKEGEK